MTFALVLVVAFGAGWSAVIAGQWLRRRGRRRSGEDFDPGYSRYLNALADADRAPP